jgi:hypothetical protein
MKLVKMFVAVLVVATLAVVGFADWSQRPVSPLPLPAPDAVEVDPPTSIQTEAEEIFSRAFWQPPGAGDKILHAERREWADATSVKKWQWFLEIEGSPELIKYLRDDNAFGLSPAQKVTSVEKAPAWFVYPAAGVDFLKSRRGKMTLCFSKSGNRLLATDAGSGLRPGAPEPIKDPIAPDSVRPPAAGRLPNSIPPTPQSR